MKYNYLLSQLKSRHIEVDRVNTCFVVNDTASISIFPKLEPGTIVRNNVMPVMSGVPVVLVENPDTGDVIPLVSTLNPNTLSLGQTWGMYNLFTTPETRKKLGGTLWPFRFPRKTRMRYLGLVRVVAGKVNADYLPDAANYFFAHGHRVRVWTYALLEVMGEDPSKKFSAWKYLRTESEEKLAETTQAPVPPRAVLDNIQKTIGLRLGTRLYVLDNIVAWPVELRDYRALAMPYKALEQDRNLRSLMSKCKPSTPLFGTSSPSWHIPFFDDRLGPEEVKAQTQKYITNELEMQQKEANLIDSAFPRETRFLRFIPKDKRTPKDRGTRYQEILAARARGETWALPKPRPKQVSTIK